LNYKSRTCKVMKVILMIGGGLVIRICDKAWSFGGLFSMAGILKSRV